MIVRTLIYDSEHSEASSNFNIVVYAIQALESRVMSFDDILMQRVESLLADP